MKTVAELIAQIQPLHVKGDLGVPVASVAINSSSVIPGSLFIAIKGEKVDGHNFIPEVAAKGATVIVYEHDTFENGQTIHFVDGVTYIKVADTHEASGLIATAFYDYPSQKLQLVGVTGTNGKTTITTLLHNLFRNLGYKTGMIGTVAVKINDEEREAVRTTPDPVSLNKILSDMVSAGCTHVFMEVSSHAVALKRIAGLTFAGGVFTNLTHDHLDFHKTIEEYAKAKQTFFTEYLSSESFALSNSESDYGIFMLEHTKAKKYFYARTIDADFSGSVETKLIGDFNHSNILAVLGTAVLLGVDEMRAREEIKKLDSAPGRFVSLTSEAGVIGIVDYAHTPDALLNVLQTINNMKGNGKVISVFGCGGDRDSAKRPVMAKIGYDFSDVTILTTDNPRSENAETILNDMKKGLPEVYAERKQVLIISDRHEAIKKAYELAVSGDYILLAGKGHENYQEVNGIKTHFDDMEELKKCFL